MESGERSTGEGIFERILPVEGQGVEVWWVGRMGFVVERACTTGGVMVSLLALGTVRGKSFWNWVPHVPSPQLERCMSPGQKLLIRCTLMSSDSSFMFTEGNPSF